jgi:hypothetical protein
MRLEPQVAERRADRRAVTATGRALRKLLHRQPLGRALAIRLEFGALLAGAVPVRVGTGVSRGRQRQADEQDQGQEPVLQDASRVGKGTDGPDRGVGEA